MWDYDHDLIPKSLNIFFNKVPCHKYKTRFVTKGKLSPCNVKSTRFDVRSFKFEGTNVLNQLKDLDIKTRCSFLKKLRSELLNCYD